MSVRHTSVIRVPPYGGEGDGEAVDYQGTWNASTNTPTLSIPPEEKGHYYVVSVAGTFDGKSFEVDDWIVSNGGGWDKLSANDSVTSVYGRDGDVVAQVGDYDTDQVTEGASNLYHTEPRVQSVIDSRKGVAEGLASLDQNVKIPLVQLPDSIVGQVEFQDYWNASTNTPTLPAATENKGHYWVTQVAGTYESMDFEVGDWIISNGVEYGKIDNTDAVSSVHGRTGAVTGQSGDYNTDQVTEGGSNLYHTPSRVRSILLTGLNTASSIAITATDSILSAFGKIQGKLNTLKAMAFRDEASSGEALAGTGTGGMTPPLVHQAFNQYGVGGVKSASSATDADAYTAGEYVTPSSGFMNFPAGISGRAIIKTLGEVGNYLVQELWDLSADRKFFRSAFGGSYKNWYEYWHTGNFNPDDYAALGSANLFTNHQEISNVTPRLSMVETDAGVDAKRWRWQANNGELRLWTETDASGLVQSTIEIVRSGSSVSDFNLTGTNINLNGVVNVDNLRLSANALESTNTGGSLQLRPDGAGQILGYYNGSLLFQSVAPSSGALQVNNMATGGGFERVLTTSDKGELDSYTVATVPSAAASEAKQIYVTDETGGAVPAFSDGTDWRRVTDRAIIA